MIIQCLEGGRVVNHCGLTERGSLSSSLSAGPAYSYLFCDSTTMKFHDLPEDIRFTICAYINPEDLLALKQVGVPTLFTGN